MAAGGLRSSSPPAAKRLRAHREEMELAVREDLSIDEARRRLSFQRFQERCAQFDARRDARAPITAGLAAADRAGRDTAPPAPWWKREDL